MSISGDLEPVVLRRKCGWISTKLGEAVLHLDYYDLVIYVRVLAE